MRAGGLVNAEPMGNGWLFKMKIDDSGELATLLDETAYRALTTAEESH